MLTLCLTFVDQLFFSDFDKNMMGIAHELQTLREMTDVISENSFFKIQEAMQSNTKNLENVIRSNER